MLCIRLLYTLLYGHLYRIPRLFSNLTPYILSQSDNVPRRFHPDKAPIIWHTVKCGVYLDPPLSKFLFYIKGKTHISAVYIGDFFNYRPERINLPLHRPAPFPLFLYKAMERLFVKKYGKRLVGHIYIRF